ncbi:hypothetical protein JTB14_002241 [Gonioctena quinquepunctata]|nr:hypothetical protein JTB14_002241 [Gonioctena quinquepunctata]
MDEANKKFNLSDNESTERMYVDPSTPENPPLTPDQELEHLSYSTPDPEKLGGAARKRQSCFLKNGLAYNSALKRILPSESVTVMIHPSQRLNYYLRQEKKPTIIGPPMGMLLGVIRGKFSTKTTRSVLAEKVIEPTITGWIYAVLINRKVHTSLQNDDISFEVYRGCPQGGVLSLLLYFLLMDNRLEVFERRVVELQAYADDLVISAKTT